MVRCEVHSFDIVCSAEPRLMTCRGHRRSPFGIHATRLGIWLYVVIYLQETQVVEDKFPSFRTLGNIGHVSLRSRQDRRSTRKYTLAC